MKSLVAALALTTLFATSQKASACAQPLPIIAQKIQLQQALSSKQYDFELNKMMNADRFFTITSINLVQGFVVVSLSNGC